MEVFFGDKASEMPSRWSKWPEPYKSIYSRMLSQKRMLVECEEYDQLKALEAKVNDFIQGIE